MLPLIWYAIVAVMLTVYVVLDGFDIGAGAIHLMAARTDSERRSVLASIGPVWDGNEVWLLAAGGTLYFAFPPLYASSFSGFYLPLMMVLWLAILRGIAVEFRSHLTNAVWSPAFDVIFCGSSALLAIFYGAALGNVIRGVPLDGEGQFFLPLWTDWTPGPQPGILDWYTVLTGLLALATLIQHGALWVAAKTEGELNGRARSIAGVGWFAVLGLLVVVTLASFSVQPSIGRNFAAYPAGFVFPALALGSLAAVFYLHRARREMAAFIASGLYITGMMTSAVFGVFPNVLPATNPALSLTIENASASPYGLSVGLMWFIPGILLATGYFVFLYRRFAGKVRLEESGH